MMKRLILGLLLITLVLSSPALARLKATRIPDVGAGSNQVSGDMLDIEDSMIRFAASHPGAQVDSFQIVRHSALGTYDIFIFYQE